MDVYHTHTKFWEKHDTQVNAECRKSCNEPHLSQTEGMIYSQNWTLAGTLHPIQRKWQKWTRVPSRSGACWDYHHGHTWSVVTTRKQNRMSSSILVSITQNVIVLVLGNFWHSSSRAVFATLMIWPALWSYPNNLASIQPSNLSPARWFHCFFLPPKMFCCLLFLLSICS